MAWKWCQRHLMFVCDLVLICIETYEFWEESCKGVSSLHANRLASSCLIPSQIPYVIICYTVGPLLKDFVKKGSQLYFLQSFFQKFIGFLFLIGNDELVKSLIFDAKVTNDFENQKSPKPRGQNVV